MDTIRHLFGWVGRKAIIFVALVTALVLHQLLLPSWRRHRDLGAEIARLRDGERALAASATALVDAGNASAADARRRSVADLDGRIAAAERARMQAERECDVGFPAALLRGGADAVIASRRACLAEVARTRELAALRAMHGTLDARRPGESLTQAVHRHAEVMRRATAANRAQQRERARLEAEVLGGYRHAGEIDRLSEGAKRSLAAYLAAKASAQRLIDARARVAAADERARAAIVRVQSDYRAYVAAHTRAWSGTAIERAGGFAQRVGLRAKLRTAAIALALIVATPFLIRLFCFFVLAPLAIRRPAIRIRVPGGGAPIPFSPPSTTSVAVRLGAGEELLVRQDYLQTTSHAGHAGTQWWLDWRKPVTSLATGLTFLTRIRGDGEVTTVSAVRDGLAEVTVLTLPAGAACVLYPRALAAVAQPIGRRLRITRHWRLGSLSAWLTLQLRFLVFHGPARLVLKGGRGVRVERAERGRVFGQDQLVGFSADLAYSVTRTETFWPYFLGREQLLKDRVLGGEGVLLIEEAPLSARRGEVRRGIEGMIDAGMKVFGM